MGNDFQLDRQQPAISIAPLVKKARLDLVVLKYMAQKLYFTISTLEQPIDSIAPLLYSIEERHARQHRIVIYKPQELLTKDDLFFVGFVSCRQKAASQHVIDDIAQADKKMLAEIAHLPGLISYSSMELRSGNWFNLIFFNDHDAKAHVKKQVTHTHAAYELAPAYYAWIRLHHGLLSGGLVNREMFLQKTKYYTFPGMGRLPAMHDVIYEKMELHHSEG
ncbi:MAG TPA: hypothetical protein VL485_11340 [Ktedonobacteraceae bacterium]|jgi:hypothetical protein|nr:hypothetical protein [Ktedonobacteraceae bacterium]